MEWNEIARGSIKRKKVKTGENACKGKGNV